MPRRREGFFFGEKKKKKKLQQKEITIVTTATTTAITKLYTSSNIILLFITIFLQMQMPLFSHWMHTEATAAAAGAGTGAAAVAVAVAALLLEAARRFFWAVAASKSGDVAFQIWDNLGGKGKLLRLEKGLEQLCFSLVVFSAR